MFSVKHGRSDRWSCISLYEFVWVGGERLCIFGSEFPGVVYYRNLFFDQSQT